MSDLADVAAALVGALLGALTLIAIHLLRGRR